MTENALAFLLGLGLSGCILIIAAVIGTPDAPDDLEPDPTDSAGDYGSMDHALKQYVNGDRNRYWFSQVADVRSAKGKE